jgi:hypothetical protein
VSVAAEAVIGIEGDVRSEPPPTDVGSAAKAEFGPESELTVVVTKLMPLLTETAVHPAGNAGDVTESKFSENVADGTPIVMTRV